MEQRTEEIRPTLVALAGLPGSGKTRFRKAFLAAREEEDWAVLSTDDLIEEAAAAAGTTYDAIKREAAKAAEKRFRAALGLALEARRNVLVDRTNLVPRKRRALTTRAEGYLKLCFWFEPPEAERRRRLANRPGKTIPRGVDAEMRRLWTRPEPEEGFDRVERVE